MGENLSSSFYSCLNSLNSVASSCLHSPQMTLLCVLCGWNVSFVHTHALFSLDIPLLLDIQADPITQQS